jgi:hypothetical protein
MTFLAKSALAILLLGFGSGCSKNTSPANNTVLLGLTENFNVKCGGHTAGLCGPQAETISIQVKGLFATEPDCRGLNLRALTEQERATPSGQLPLLFELYYVGTHADYYEGAGKGEDEGWLLSFNGPNGYFVANTNTESDAVRRVCLAAKGLGGKIEKSTK